VPGRRLDGVPAVLHGIALSDGSVSARAAARGAAPGRTAGPGRAAR
jgi:hypothetical protein